MGRKIGLGRIWSFVLGFRSLVTRLVPFERGGTKPEGEKIFGNGKCELIANFSATIWKRGNKAWGRKNFWQWKVWTHCEFQRHHGDLSAKGETGSVKTEGRNENCEFLARESVSSSPIVRIFGKGKCKFIANFSATMVTSLPSLSVCISLSLSLSLSLSPKVPHAQYRKRFRASYNIDSGPVPSNCINGWLYHSRQ